MERLEVECKESSERLEQMELQRKEGLQRLENMMELEEVNMAKLNLSLALILKLQHLVVPRCDVPLFQAPRAQVGGELTEL